MLTTTTVSGRGMRLSLVPSLPSISLNKTKVFCPRRLAPVRATGSSSGSDYSSSDDLPSSSSSSPVPDTLPVAGVDTDWRAFRARLVASSSNLATEASDNPSTTSSSSSSILVEDDVWAHEITTLEPGCLLLASPVYFTHSQTYFNKAVILLADHSPSGGSIGFILNKPTEHKIAGVNVKGLLSEQLNPCTLYLGGDVNRESVSVVHNVRGLEDTREIVPGVFLGGIHSLGKKIESGDVTPSELKIMTGMAGWGPGQLQSEVARGVWIVASASKHLILSASVAGMGEELWHATMQMMGGDYAALSQAEKETYRADIMELPPKPEEEEGNTTTSSSYSSGGGSMLESTQPPVSEDGEEPRGGGGEPSSPSSSKGPWKPPRRDPGHNYGSGI